MSIQFPAKAIGSFDAYLSYVNSLPVLDEAQEKALFIAYQEKNDLIAAQKIIVSHLRFVAFIAKSYQGYGLPVEDLVQEGTIGLMKSVKKFSLDFGVRLASFSVHYIKSEIHEFVIRNWRLVKATTTKAKRKLFFNLRRIQSRDGFLTKNDKQEISQQLGVSEKEINEMEVQLLQSDIFIDSSAAHANEDEKGLKAEYLLEDKSEHFAETLIRDNYQNIALGKIRSIVNHLDDRAQDIIEKRWFSEEKYTQKFFAEKYGVSQERIRQIEEKALLEMRKALKSL